MTKTEKVIISILTILLGVAFIVWEPEAVIGYAATAAGIYLCVYGGYDIAKGNQGFGIIKVIVGALFIFFPWLISNILVYIFGAFLIILGVFYLIEIFNRKLKGAGMLFVLLVAILYLVVGILIIVNVYAAQYWIIILMGVSLIIDGAISLVDALTSKGKKSR